MSTQFDLTTEEGILAIRIRIRELSHQLLGFDRPLTTAYIIPLAELLTIIQYLKSAVLRLAPGDPTAPNCLRQIMVAETQIKFLMALQLAQNGVGPSR